MVFKNHLNCIKMKTFPSTIMRKKFEEGRT